MKAIIPRSRAITVEFTEALKALCRAKGLDVKHAWPLADAKRLAFEEARKFEEARADGIERHKLDSEPATAAEVAADALTLKQRSKLFQAEMKALLNTPVEFGIEANSIIIADGALTGDVLEQVSEFVKRP